MSRLTEVIAIVNNKGGVGKTTTAVSLACAIHRTDKHKRVLVIDLDSQCNASMLLGWKSKSETRPTVFDALSHSTALPVYSTSAKQYDADGGVYLCPSHKFMSDIDTSLRQHRPAEKVLLKAFSRDIAPSPELSLPTDITEAFDYIIIDCPPALGDITYNALVVADSIMIPVQAERLAIDGLSKSISIYKECKSDLNPDISFRGVLLTMLDERTSATRDYVDLVRDTYGEAVLNTRIRRCTKVVEAQGLDRDLYDYAPYCTTALDYMSLAKEVIG